MSSAELSKASPPLVLIPSAARRVDVVLLPMMRLEVGGDPVVAGDCLALPVKVIVFQRDCELVACDQVDRFASRFFEPRSKLGGIGNGGREAKDADVLRQKQEGLFPHGAALRMADRAYVMETGRVALAGPATELAQDPRVQALYLGGTQATAAR